jgi:hypothetical protein
MPDQILAKIRVDDPLETDLLVLGDEKGKAFVMNFFLYLLDKIDAVPAVKIDKHAKQICIMPEIDSHTAPIYIQVDSMRIAFREMGHRYYVDIKVAFHEGTWYAYQGDRVRIPKLP